MERFRVDGNLRPVPVFLKEVFDGRDELYRWMREISRLKRDISIRAKQGYGSLLDIDAIQEHLEAARAMVTRAAPFARCVCKPREDCELCNGRHWVSVDNVRPSHGDLMGLDDGDADGGDAVE